MLIYIAPGCEADQLIRLLVPSQYVKEIKKCDFPLVEGSQHQQATKQSVKVKVRE